MMKCLSVLLAVVTLCASLLVMPASATASQTTFSLSCTEGNVGDTVTVSVDISDDSGFTNATVYLHYNAEAVEFVKEGVGAVASDNNGMFMVNNLPAEGYVKGGYIALYPAMDAGTLFTYKFKVKAYKAAGFSLSFDECQGEDENGNIFDLNYTATTCVLNKDAGGADSTTKPNNTTKAPTSSKPTTTKAGGGQAQTTTTATPAAPTTTVTYPTDTNGITLAPWVVTETDGSAATEAGGEVITMATTTVATDVDAADATTTSTDVAPIVEKSNTVVYIVVAALLLVAGGVTAVMFVLRKKKNSN